MKTALLVAFAFFANIALACESSMVGVFTGNIDGGGPTSKTMITMNGAALEGAYMMSDFPEDEGKIANITVDCNTLTLSGEWTDQFGSGTIEFVYAPDFSSFTGTWLTMDKTGGGGWSGTR